MIVVAHAFENLARSIHNSPGFLPGAAFRMVELYLDIVSKRLMHYLAAPRFTVNRNILLENGEPKTRRNSLEIRPLTRTFESKQLLKDLCCYYQQTIWGKITFRCTTKTFGTLSLSLDSVSVNFHEIRTLLSL